MKIPSSVDALALLKMNAIRTKKDGQGGAGQNQYESMGQKKKDQGQGQSDSGSNPEKNSEKEPDFEKVIQAVQAFEDSSKAKESGIHAEPVGVGPGLKVVLKDARGSIIRSLSGSEFLELKEATVRKDGQPRGKILDQKL